MNSILRPRQIIKKCILLTGGKFEFISLSSFKIKQSKSNHVSLDTTHQSKSNRGSLDKGSGSLNNTNPSSSVLAFGKIICIFLNFSMILNSRYLKSRRTLHVSLSDGFSITPSNFSRISTFQFSRKCSFSPSLASFLIFPDHLQQ
jgi:hypothetical protein